ncbi:DUF4136 domain-containing protein [Dyadobacter chenwenxiniae]|uniref:DUF4136 domain-containing protein n=1 Tax=Dyadobacter chenwenxiniae TaxID=2906456 RepID=A0A9X1PN07_9BACT|nr:DUF4136 domain-containing protein [Dyadobacter chenwenxiniae]MCF0064322.1 DUF4136 domain-containing protein [Dyadobacter chenwenxiniae]UON82467.1 DUF4136 domain-containing protein [Dyadobacter chenwenxiniae]
MEIFRLSSVVLLFLSVFTSCSSSYKILKSQQEDNFKLSDYATFGFYDIEAKGDTISQNFEKNIGIIKTAIAQNLQSKGLDEARDASLIVNIALNVQEKAQTRQTDFRTDGLPRYMGQRRYSWKSEEVVVGKYREGTIMIDLVDAATNKMVWQGGAEGIIPEKSQNFENDVNQAVKEIIENIPK